MNKCIDIKQVSGSINIPPSKSFSQRVLAAALLHNGKTVVHHFGNSKDELAVVKIIQLLGAEVLFEEGRMTISSKGTILPIAELDCQESGFAARIFTPIAALASSPITICGSGSLLHRSMDFLKQPLQDLGVQFPSFSGRLPFTICGPIKPKNIKLDASESSQFLSGLLLALSATANEKIEIEVTSLVSKPYIDMTLETLALFGKKITHTDYRLFQIEPANFKPPTSVTIQIESDWSSAAFWIAAACIKGAITLKGLNEHSLQADKKILGIVAQLGATATWDAEALHVAADRRNAFHTDLNDAPDLFPVLSILAACCLGTSSIKGLKRLENKESNRAESIVALLGQLGVPFRIQEDTLFIDGVDAFPVIHYDCPNDHRMAMAAALVALRSHGGIETSNAGCVAKSYPSFWEELATMA